MDLEYPIDSSGRMFLEVDRFVAEKLPDNAKCNLCGYEDLHVAAHTNKGGHGIPENEVPALQLNVPIDPNLNKALGFYSLVCPNCGNTYFLAAPIVNAWLAKNPSE